MTKWNVWRSNWGLLKELQESINPFHGTGLFLCPLKTSENQRFSDVFKGYRKRPVVWNRLKKFLCISSAEMFGNYSTSIISFTFWERHYFIIVILRRYKIHVNKIQFLLQERYFLKWASKILVRLMALIFYLLATSACS